MVFHLRKRSSGRAARNATLFFFRSEPLQTSSEADNALFELFARVFGLFMLLHVFYYWFRGFTDTFEATSIPILFFGFILVVWPQMRPVFVVSIITLAVDGWRHAPVFSNHTILLNFLILTFLVGGIWHLIRGSSWARYFADIRPVGRVLLLLMYVFGILHKINTDFLDPSNSCAVVLWGTMPPPLAWIEHSAMHYLVIYGTFVVEGAIVIMLLFPRWRHWGICAGIAFHSLLALSGFDMYVVFTTLAIALHILFITPDAALRITRSHPFHQFDTALRHPAGISLLILTMGLIAANAYIFTYQMVGLLWLILTAAPLVIIAVKGTGLCVSKTEEHALFWSRTLFLNAIPVLFVISCMGPYLGFKTAQSMNMFANLQVEGETSNHLLFTQPLISPAYIDDVVFITEAYGSEPLEQAAENSSIGQVYYQFLSLLEQEPPGATVAYIKGDDLVPLTPVSEILSRDADMLHPEWVRKFLHFLPVGSGDHYGICT